jgi:hypothetical protein
MFLAGNRKRRTLSSLMRHDVVACCSSPTGPALLADLRPPSSSQKREVRRAGDGLMVLEKYRQPIGNKAAMRICYLSAS